MKIVLRRLALLLSLGALSACAVEPPLEEAMAPPQSETEVELALGCGIPGDAGPEGPDDGIGGTGCPAM